MRREGAPPQGRMASFSEGIIRHDAALDTTPLDHTYRLHFLIPGHLLEFRDESMDESMDES